MVIDDFLDADLESQKVLLRAIEQLRRSNTSKLQIVFVLCVQNGQSQEALAYMSHATTLGNDEAITEALDGLNSRDLWLIFKKRAEKKVEMTAVGTKLSDPTHAAKLDKVIQIITDIENDISGF